MGKVPLPMTGGFYVSRSLPISAQLCSNLYVHVNEGGGLSEEALYGTPGAVMLATSGPDLQINRGSHVMNGIAYYVNGTTLYRLTQAISDTGVETFTMDNIGAIGGTGRVSMADNGTQLCILIPGGNGFIWVESTSTFTQITDGDFDANGDPQHVIYIDGYFLFTTDTKKFIVSALNNGLAYDALDFGSAEADPDTIVAPMVHNNVLYIFGSETFEAFRNQGGSGFPFSRISGAVTSLGLSSPFSLVLSTGVFGFIGAGENEEPSIYTYNGSKVALISTDAIDDLLGHLTEAQLADVFGWSYSQSGDRFMGFTLPDTTIVYDMKSQKWHERKSFDIIDGVASEFRWRANSVVKAYNRILIGDNQDGRVGEIDLDYYDEYGQNIIAEFATKPFSNMSQRLLVPSIELTLEAGVGNVDDTDPVISMSRSTDGKTWTPRRERRLGKLGEYGKRAIWRRNGRAASYEVFRWSISSKVKKVFIKLEADIV
tara:strand:- start:1494 stop:2948 length:1455 start_codon:yes stop_codon:yes gene_type:complete